jgi:hypothetical protein
MGKFKITKDTKDIHCRVKIGDNPEADGTIIRQKASKRFFVTDGKTNGICTVSDLEENSLTSNTMTLTVVKQDGTLHRVEYLSNKFATDFDKNRFIITGATTDAYENATVLTDDAKAKLSKPKKVVKKAVAKKAVVKKVVKKAVVKEAVVKEAVVKKTVVKKAAVTQTTISEPNVTVGAFKISED